MTASADAVGQFKGNCGFIFIPTMSASKLFPSRSIKLAFLPLVYFSGEKVKCFVTTGNNKDFPACTSTHFKCFNRICTAEDSMLPNSSFLVFVHSYHRKFSFLLSERTYLHFNLLGGLEETGCGG